MADDSVSLRADTLAILRQVLAAKEAASAAAAAEATDTDVSLLTSESWQISPVWYTPETSAALANEVLRLAEGVRASRADSSPVRVACLSCPSTFKALRAVRSSAPAAAAAASTPLASWIFEYDPRFAVFGDAFVQYDYNAPLAVPAALLGTIDVIVMDPPFLNADCLGGFAATVRALQREAGGPILLCTGAVMAPHARRLLGLRPTRMPVHHANRLSNPFAAFVNYDEGGRLGGIDTVAEELNVGEGGGAIQ